MRFIPQQFVIVIVLLTISANFLEPTIVCFAQKHINLPDDTASADKTTLDKFRAENVDLAQLCDETLVRATETQKLFRKIAVKARPTFNPYIAILSGAKFMGVRMAPSVGTPQLGDNMGTCVNPLAGMQRPIGLTQTESVVLFDLVRRQAYGLQEAYSAYVTTMNELDQTPTNNGLFASKRSELVSHARKNRSILIEFAGRDAVGRLDERHGFIKFVDVTSTTRDPNNFVLLYKQSFLF